MRLRVAPMDNEIPNVRNPGEGVGKNKHRIPLVKQRVTEQQQRSRQTQPPKSRRHDDALEFLGGIPLDEEAGEENEVAEPADDFPDMPMDPQEFAVVPEELVKPIHVENLKL